MFFSYCDGTCPLNVRQTKFAVKIIFSNMNPDRSRRGRLAAMGCCLARGVACRRTVSIVTMFLAAVIGLRANQTDLDDQIKNALTEYAAGHWDEAIAAVHRGGLTIGAFLGSVDRWIGLESASDIDARRMVACAFALETVWAATRTPLQALRRNIDPWGRVTPDRPDRVALTSYVSQGIVAAWAVKTLGSTRPRPDTKALERLLFLGAIGVSSDGSAWHRLQEEVVPIASTRLGDEPRLALVGTLARIFPHLGSLRDDTLRRGDVLHRERLPSQVRSRIPPAIAALDLIRDKPSLTWEVETWAGYLYLRLENWAESLARLQHARVAAEDPTSIALVNYLSGWVHEQRGETSDAIAAYRRALAAAPRQRDVAWRLSALLYLSHHREEAYALLDALLASGTAPQSLLMTLERGDGRYVTELFVSIRKVLR